MSEQIVKANGVELWTEILGEGSGSPVLLIMGAGGQGILWENDFCQGLVDGGHAVIRYDHRDTGLSTCFNLETDPYTIDDLTADAVGVLDALGCEAAHVVGGSMGGMIAQLMALDYTEHVLTLTSIVSSPGGAESAGAVVGGGGSGTGLPGPTPEFVAAAQEVFATPPSTREELIEARVRMMQATAGPGGPFDAEEMRRSIAEQYDRAVNFAAADNHATVIASSPSRLHRLGEITCPTLIIHGTADPIFPVAHGETAAEAIPHAELLTIDGLGHEVPRWAWPTMIPAMLKLMASRDARLPTAP